MISIITRIQIEGNDTVSFQNGTNYVQSMSQIMPQIPTYISYGYDSITITQGVAKPFQFSIYQVTQVGGNSFTALTFQDSADDVQKRTIDIYKLLVTVIFKGCCECGNTEPECAIQYTYGTSGLSGQFDYTYGTPGLIRFNEVTGNNQNFSGFFPTVQDGSWVFLFSKTDPTVYAIIQLYNYSGSGGIAGFDAIELNANGTPFTEGTVFCVDFTSVGGSLVQGWQDTLNINPNLNQDNTVDGGGYNFIFDNNNSFEINTPYGTIENNSSGVSLVAGLQSVTVTGGYIDINTPLIGTASTGWVLSLTASGHVEYVAPPVSNVYTVANGLHYQESPFDDTVFHLGGNLIETTTIFNQGFDFIVERDSNGVALTVNNIGTQVGTSSDALKAVTTDGLAGDFYAGENFYAIDEIQPIVKINRTTILPPDGEFDFDNIGGSIDFINPTVLGAFATQIPYSSRIASRWTRSLNEGGFSISRPVGRTEIWNYDGSGSQSLTATFNAGNYFAGGLASRGLVQLNQYGQGTFYYLNTPAYALGVDSIGNIIEIDISSGGSGTVTSVDLSVPTPVNPAFSVSGNPITTSGTLAISANGTSSQYVDGTGALQTFPTIPTYTVNNGLTANPTSTNFQLGGPLIQNTTVDGVSTYSMTFDGLNDFFVNSIADIFLKSETTYKNWTPANPTAPTYTHHDVDPGYNFMETVDQDLRLGGVTYNQLYMKSSLTGTKLLNLVHNSGGINVGMGFGIHSAFSTTTPCVTLITTGVAQGTTTVGQVLVLKSMTGTDKGRVEFETLTGTGTVTSVGLSVPTPVNPAFSVSGSPILTSGTLAISANGLVSDYIDGTGALQTFPTIPVYTVDNGLTPNPSANNFQLGGSLLQITTIDGDNYPYEISDLDTYYSQSNSYTYLESGKCIPPVFQTNSYGIDGLAIDGQTTFNLGTVTSGVWDCADPLLAPEIGGTFYVSAADGNNTATILSYNPSTCEITLDVAITWVGPIIVPSADIDVVVGTIDNPYLLLDRGGDHPESNGLPTASLILHDCDTGQEVGVKAVNDTGTKKLLLLTNDYSTKTAGDVVTLVDPLTGEVEFQTPASGGGLKSGTATQVTAGVYTTTITGVTSLAAGDTFIIKFDSVNDGASTLNINSLGAYDIFKNTDIKISSGDIKANQEITIVYDGSAFQAIGLVTNQLLAYVHNEEGSVITKGQVVYAYQANGDKMSVKLALADADDTSAKTVGMVYDSFIAINGEGYIIIQGVIEGINTAAFTAGDTLYLSGSVPGGYVSTPTYAPVHRVYVGIVEKANAGNGQIYVRCQNGYELDEIHDVDLITTPPVNNDVLVFDTSTTPDLWVAKSIPTILGYTPVTNARTISTTSPLSGGGDLTADRTFSIANAAADGSTKGAAAFTANDFDDNGSGLISIDYTNGQKATASQPGFLTAADWTTFNTKVGSDYFTLRFTIANVSPADNQNYILADITPNLNTTGTLYRVTFPYACKLVGAGIHVINLTSNATTEASTFNFRLNNSTDTLLSNAVVMSGAANTFNVYNITGLSTSIAANDTAQIKWTTPTWVTNPSAAYIFVHCYFERT